MGLAELTVYTGKVFRNHRVKGRYNLYVIRVTSKEFSLAFWFLWIGLSTVSWVYACLSAELSTEVSLALYIFSIMLI